MRSVRLKLAIVVAAVAALAAPGAAPAATDSYEGTAFHPFTMPANAGCVAVAEADGSTSYNCDPVNVIFPGRTWQQVRDWLRSKGWTTWGLGSTQFLHFETPTRVANAVQLFRSDGSIRRYHIRLWRAPSGLVVGGVHHEQGFLEHTIDKSWDASEAFVRGQLCTTACSTALLPTQKAIQDGVDGDPDADPLWRGWANDGSAAVIR